MRAAQYLGHARKQRMIEVDRVMVDIEISDRRAAEILVEDEMVLPAIAGYRDATADIGKGVVAGGPIHHRRTRTDERDSQRLSARRGMPVADQRLESQG